MASLFFPRVPQLQFGDRHTRQFRVAVEVMRIQDRAHVAQAVTGDAGDLRLGAADKREPGYGGAAQIVEGHAGDAGVIARLEERGAESVRRPRAAQEYLYASEYTGKITARLRPSQSIFASAEMAEAEGRLLLQSLRTRKESPTQ
jgi:hypothetical protein